MFLKSEPSECRRDTAQVNENLQVARVRALEMLAAVGRVELPSRSVLMGACGPGVSRLDEKREGNRFSGG